MFRPCIDLHNGKVKQIVGSTLETGDLVTNFTATQPPSWFANLFKQHNLKNGHIIMLGPGNQEAALSAIKAFPFGLQIGGGITDQNYKLFLDHGASHIIITSWIFPDGVLNTSRLKRIFQKVGKKNLVIDLSCKKIENKYFVTINRWNTITETELNEETINFFESYCDELLIHAVDVEGKSIGIDKKLISDLSQMGQQTITYAGGANSLDDFEYIYQQAKGRIKLTVGSALDIFGGNKISFSEAVKFHNEHN